MPAKESIHLTDDDRRAIFSVCDCLIARAGRTTLMMALRGSRAKRVLQYEADQAHGYGRYAGQPESAAMARIDALFTEGLLRFEYRDGLPLLAYTETGLDRAMGFAAEDWLSVLRSRAQSCKEGAALELPFVPSAMPDRNLTTVLLLADLVGRAADPTWLPLLRAWQAAETRRLRNRLGLVIAALEEDQTKGKNQARTPPGP